jgi:hypothetical protein
VINCDESGLTNGEDNIDIIIVPAVRPTQKKPHLSQWYAGWLVKTSRRKSHVSCPHRTAAQPGRPGWPDTDPQISLAVAVTGDDDTVASTSDVVAQPILEGAIDNLNMTGPLVLSLSKPASSRCFDPCHGSVFDPVVIDLAACDAAAAINGIDVRSSGSRRTSSCDCAR